MKSLAIPGLLGIFFFFALNTINCVDSFLLDDLNIDDEASIPELRVAAFNVRHFGRSTVKEAHLVRHLVKYFSRYDIVLLQEVRDAKNEALDALAKALRKKDKHWSYVASEVIGRTKYYMEQYVFFYRKSKAFFVSSYQVNDTAHDVYEREPFTAEFTYYSVHKKAKQNVVLLALHTRPTNTKNELIQLPNTIRDVSKLFPKSSGVIALGDMNADCDYLAGKWRKSLEIFNSDEFRSLIPETADSAVKASSDCAYDRVIVYGKELVVKDAGVYNFKKKSRFSEKHALQVSDHFPVEFSLL